MKTIHVILSVVMVVPIFIYLIYRNTEKISATVQQIEPLIVPEPMKMKTKVNNASCIDNTFRSVYSYQTKWKINTDVCNGCFNFVKTRLKTSKGVIPIHVYTPKEDKFVSSRIIQYGLFEAPKIDLLLKYLKSDPSLNFIDIGANLGVFTLNVAKFGRKVLAVEALNKNVQHLCLSVRDGKLQNNIKIIHNALSDKSGVTVNLGVDVNNMGGTFVDDEAENTKKVKQYWHLEIGGTYGSVNTFTLDNLLDLEEMKDFKNVIIKIDIEGFEYKALIGGQKFFDSINIKAVFMEWVFHKGTSSGKKIIDFMIKRNFIPYLENGAKELDPSKSEAWDWNVLWLRKV
ncbi:hypothetical protein KUTeg_019595 [Tegillarca granosa]|uniref:Methyltransferase FkbM domain-containing protein n=1 Tax=Tegillarca granosa TaxID=220873 RepID=A0ABQ9ED06_TEGGR|nr:hypothetical protein KUTeg_019595 [Tegillarca granosa]